MSDAAADVLPAAANSSNNSNSRADATAVRRAISARNSRSRKQQVSRKHRGPRAKAVAVAGVAVAVRVPMGQRDGPSSNRVLRSNRRRRHRDRLKIRSSRGPKEPATANGNDDAFVDDVRAAVAAAERRRRLRRCSAPAWPAERAPRSPAD
jgi:hypothetical protein